LIYKSSGYITDYYTLIQDSKQGVIMDIKKYEGHKFPEEKQNLLALIKKQLWGNG